MLPKFSAVTVTAVSTPRARQNLAVHNAGRIRKVSIVPYAERMFLQVLRWVPKDTGGVWEQNVGRKGLDAWIGFRMTGWAGPGLGGLDGRTLRPNGFLQAARPIVSSNSPSQDLARPLGLITDSGFFAQLKTPNGHHEDTQGQGHEAYVCSRHVSEPVSCSPFMTSFREGCQGKGCEEGRAPRHARARSAQSALFRLLPPPQDPPPSPHPQVPP